MSSSIGSEVSTPASPNSTLERYGGGGGGGGGRGGAGQPATGAIPKYQYQQQQQQQQHYQQKQHHVVANPPPAAAATTTRVWSYLQEEFDQGVASPGGYAVMSPDDSSYHSQSQVGGTTDDKSSWESQFNITYFSRIPYCIY